MGKNIILLLLNSTLTAIVILCSFKINTRPYYGWSAMIVPVFTFCISLIIGLIGTFFKSRHSWSLLFKSAFITQMILGSLWLFFLAWGISANYDAERRTKHDSCLYSFEKYAKERRFFHENIDADTAFRLCFKNLEKDIIQRFGQKVYEEDFCIQVIFNKPIDTIIEACQLTKEYAFVYDIENDPPAYFYKCYSNNDTCLIMTNERLNMHLNEWQLIKNQTFEGMDSIEKTLSHPWNVKYSDPFKQDIESIQ